MEDWKTTIHDSKVEYKDLPPEGGLDGFTGTITLTHRASIDYLSFPKLRSLILLNLQLEAAHLHLYDDKKKPEKKKKPAPEVKEEPASEKKEAKEEPAPERKDVPPEVKEEKDNH